MYSDHGYIQLICVLNWDLPQKTEKKTTKKEILKYRSKTVERITIYFFFLSTAPYS